MNLSEFILSSPTPFHAVDTAKKMLEEQGFTELKESENVSKTNARVAQLVERDLAKVEAAGSSPVSRSYFYMKRISLKDILFLFI